MTIDFSAGPQTRALWQRVGPIMQRTESLPFLNQLADGSLDPSAFVNYIRQDGLYLLGYARAMALLSAKAGSRPESRFWAQSSASAITVEEGMHADLLADARLAQACRRQGVFDVSAQASPTTLGYVSFLVAAAATESYEVGVAGVLPCFWVYAHVGKVLARKAGTLAAGHPYATWIAAYDSDVFDQSARQAVGILEQALLDATEAQRARMAAVFEQACVYEWHFWATAHAMQGWSLD